MAFHTETQKAGTRTDRHKHVGEGGYFVRLPGGPTDASPARSDLLQKHVPQLVRFPQRLSQAEFYAVAYPIMYLSRRMDERLLELYQKGYVKGTMAGGCGNEATAVGMAVPLRPGRDVVAILHRDLAAHLLLGATPYQMFCQYMANAHSPTHAREGNVHHGDAARRRFPMLSHLGKMLSVAVGGTWAARREDQNVFGLAVIGDGGSSTGEFHEAINLASVRRVPVLFLIENNHYSFSTPTSLQYHCRHLSDRAHGYGIKGMTINGLDPWEVYSTVCDLLEMMEATSLPAILECMTLRLGGHAAYDKAEYIPAELAQRWREQDPLPAARKKMQELCGLTDTALSAMEEAVEEEIRAALTKALSVERPQPTTHRMAVFADSTPPTVPPYRASRVKNGEAVGRALEYLLQHEPKAFLFGLDVGPYGSAFKTCKGLFERFGPERVMDMPICEPALVGFALGASQVGMLPILEFQFADFSTEAVTQLGLNTATWFFRSGRPAPVLIRLPCGGGVTLGAFHSGEYEGLWSRFPGLKLLYPATAQETFEALLAGFYDPNPCLVFEHKLLYWSKSGEIDFDGNLEAVWRSRRYTEGNELTVVAFGAMLHECLAVAAQRPQDIELWNPFVLQPMNLGPIIDSVRKTGRLLVVQESSAGAGLGERLIATVCQEALDVLKSPPRLLAAPDMPLPFAPELEAFHRPDARRIMAVIEQLIDRGT